MGDWLPNQQENKLREDSWEHLLQLQFQWQSVWCRRCLVPDFKLIEHHQEMQEMSMFHPRQHKHMVNDTIRIFRRLFMEVGKDQLEWG